MALDCLRQLGASAGRHAPDTGYRHDSCRNTREGSRIVSVAGSIVISPERMTFFHSIGLT